MGLSGKTGLAETAGLPGRIRLFGKTGCVIIIAGILWLAEAVPVCAAPFSYEPCYRIPEEAAGEYMVLTEDLGNYEVCEGDCLWNISEQYLGTGERYPELMEMNPDVITNSDLIYPHTLLRLTRNVYVRKETASEGTRMGSCRFGALTGCTVGFAQEGEAYSSLAFTRPDHGRVVCHIRDKVQAGVDTLSDWEKCRDTIEEYAEEHFGEQVTDLTFQRYQSERGDEVYQFSYVYTVMGEAYGLEGTLPVYVSHGICQTEHIQAEFVGFHTEEGMEDVVRYLVAGFEELPSPEGGAGSMNDYNIIMGSPGEWELAGIYDSFDWIREYFDGIFREAVPPEAEEKSAKERILGIN